jgi:hypothetical protein
MPRLKDMKKKFVIYEINVLLAEMGFFSKLKKKKIKFNTNVINENQQYKIDNFDKTEESIVDLQFDISKDVDRILEEHEIKSEEREPESFLKTRQELPLEEIIEIRNQEIKKPEIPHFSTELNSNNYYGELDKNKELFDVEIPNNIESSNENKHYLNPDYNNLNVEENKKPQRYFMDLNRIKFWNKSSNQNQGEQKKSQEQLNNFSNTKISLEKTKKDIEEQERTLGYANKLENQMKDELKKKAEQKKREEKLRKLELKKKTKEDKLRQLKAEKAKKQMIKEEKREQKDKLRGEKLKEKEIKKLELKRLNAEKLKQQEFDRLEKLKQKELKKLQEEKEKAEKQKQELIKQKEEELRLKKLQEESQGEIKHEEPPEMGKFIQKETITKDESPYLDDDVKKLLPIIDQLLEKLPDDVVDDFAQSENFALYEKVINKYKRK